MSNKSFNFIGFTFTPVRNFTPEEEEDKEIGLSLCSIGIGNYKNIPHLTRRSNSWNWDLFYEKAKEADAVADIYLLNGIAEVIPGTNELFAYTKYEAAKLERNTISTIGDVNDKPCEEERNDLYNVALKVLHFFADLNGRDWIKGDGPGEIDMRQRAKALHRSLYNVTKQKQQNV